MWQTSVCQVEEKWCSPVGLRRTKPQKEGYSERRLLKQGDKSVPRPLLFLVCLLWRQSLALLPRLDLIIHLAPACRMLGLQMCARLPYTRWKKILEKFGRTSPDREKSLRVTVPHRKALAQFHHSHPQKVCKTQPQAVTPQPGVGVGLSCCQGRETSNCLNYLTQILETSKDFRVWLPMKKMGREGEMSSLSPWWIRETHALAGQPRSRQQGTPYEKRIIGEASPQTSTFPRV